MQQENELKRSLKSTSINTQKIFRTDMKQKRNYTHKKKNQHKLIAKDIKKIKKT